MTDLRYSDLSSNGRIEGWGGGDDSKRAKPRSTNFLWEKSSQFMNTDN